MKENQNCVSQPLCRARSLNEYVKKAITAFLSHVKKIVETITFDNGKEFVLHKEIAEEIECDTYFSRPHRSPDRGLNENANGLLR